MKVTLESVRVQGESGSLPTFIARPEGAGSFPGLVVVMEAFGLNNHIKSVAARLAAEGYVVAAPDLYYRDNSTVVGYDNLQEAIRLMMSLWDEKILQDMAATISYLQTQRSVRADRIGVTGFCMGGRVTFLTACHNSAVKAAAPFYGGGIASAAPSERTPKPPLAYAENLSCPMLLFFGDQDPFIPQAEVEQIKNELQRLRKNAEVVVYPGAPHGFFCDERDSYRADAAGDAWKRLLQFLQKHLRD
jgi:carboxymethylenebutenolidase